MPAAEPAACTAVLRVTPDDTSLLAAALAVPRRRPAAVPAAAAAAVEVLRGAAAAAATTPVTPTTATAAAGAAAPATPAAAAAVTAAAAAAAGVVSAPAVRVRAVGLPTAAGWLVLQVEPQASRALPHLHAAVLVLQAQLLEGQRKGSTARGASQFDSTAHQHQQQPALLCGQHSTPPPATLRVSQPGAS